MEHKPINFSAKLDSFSEQEGLSLRNLKKAIGQRSRVYEILNGQRNLALAVARRLG